MMVCKGSNHKIAFIEVGDLVHVYIYVYTYIHMYIYMYISIYLIAYTSHTVSYGLDITIALIEDIPHSSWVINMVVYKSMLRSSEIVVPLVTHHHCPEQDAHVSYLGVHPTE